MTHISGLPRHSVPRNDRGTSICHSELVSESITKQTLKRVQGDNIVPSKKETQVRANEERVLCSLFIRLIDNFINYIY
ncbi:hypothetical protein IJ541_06760 [bacterium]|nr:hypothetical protein [bacterium]